MSHGEGSFGAEALYATSIAEILLRIFSVDSDDLNALNEFIDEHLKKAFWSIEKAF